MDQTTDLDDALGFVIRRINEEAKLAGDPLDNEQHFLLNNLPRNVTLSQEYVGDPISPPPILFRDLAYEKLCALAKTAHHHDIQMDPALTQVWEFAAAVAKLNDHPITWLLHWAGVKPPRSCGDFWFLIASALLLVLSFVGVAVLAPIQPWMWFQWTVLIVVYTAFAVFLYFVSRRIEKFQLKQAIERYRHSSAFSVHIGGQSVSPTVRD